MKQKARNSIWKHLGRTFVIVFVVCTLTGLIRWEHIDIDLFISSAIFGIIQYWLTEKAKNSIPFFCTLFNIILLNVFVGRLLDGGYPTIGIPNIFMEIVGATVGHLCSVGTRMIKVTALLLGFSVATFIYVNHDRWLHYNAFGNFSGDVSPEVAKEWKAYSGSKDTLSTSSCKDKVVVLDFWNNGCAVCFTKFPQLQQLYNKYRNSERVMVVAVNIPWDGDEAGIAFKRIEDKKYTFPVVVGLNGMDTTFGVEVYPTTIVMDDNKVIYRGDLEGVEKVLEEQLRKK